MSRQSPRLAVVLVVGGGGWFCYFTFFVVTLQCLTGVVAGASVLKADFSHMSGIYCVNFAFSIYS